MFNEITDKEAFWQAKYDYYKTLILWVVVASSVASILYFISDCYLMGGFNTATLIPRLAIIIPMTIFLVARCKCASYKVMVPLAYVVAHGVMWCTIWACVYLTDLSFAVEGFVIINYVFLALGIGTPIHMAIISHGLLLVDIIIANTFIPYPDFNMMLLLGVPSYLGICAYNMAVEKSIRDQFKLRKQLESNLIHDALTGAYNRNIIGTLVGADKKFVTPMSKNVSIIMFDLDFFKKVNDKYGHDVGDEVLVGITHGVMDMLGDEDKLIRWGGEEFIIVTYTSIDKAAKKAEQIRAAVEKLELPVKPVTISMGVATFDGDDYEHMVKAADEALYIAKEQGRNRVVIAR